MSRVLVLNSSYAPLGSVSWERAIVLLYENKAEVLEEYQDQVIRSVSITIKMPAVIRLKKYIKAKVVGVRFNKSNVYLRDKGRCQYCLSKITETKSTYDHVIPKSRGGKTEWTNIVTSCYGCNQAKNDKTPEEAGMRLAANPIRPTSLPLGAYNTVRYSTKYPDLWKDYLGVREIEL